MDVHSQAKVKSSPYYFVLILILLVGALFLSLNILQKPRGVSCTLEAKICPDGSSVGRVPPNCEFAPCPIILTTPAIQNIDDSCDSNDDCLLINKDVGIDCCGSNKCQSIDYSQDKWIAVNIRWQLNQMQNYCPGDEKCSTCFPKPINNRFDAVCRNNLCKKVPLPKSLDQNQEVNSSGWRSYIDPTNNFSIKYPSDWIYQNACEGGDREEKYPCFHSPDFKVREAGVLFGNPSAGGEIILFVDQAIKMDVETGWIVLPLCPKNIYEYQFPCNKLQIGDIEAWRSSVISSEAIPSYPVAPNTIHLSFIHNGFHYRWTGYYNDQSKNEVVEVFDKMLSTFKFVD
ncbi:hypothetical protein HY612_05195 [Candidatus Roizmanbacteria bacterium]|nr:hypothetical protein [Candidatus Roizmanbacteria bacterium]